MFNSWEGGNGREGLKGIMDGIKGRKGRREGTMKVEGTVRPLPARPSEKFWHSHCTCGMHLLLNNWFLRPPG
jgi:hypothetical protein